MPVSPPSASQHRLVIFGDPAIIFAGPLVDAFLTALRQRNDIELIALIDTAREPRPTGIMNWILGKLGRGLRLLFNPQNSHMARTPSLYRVARDHGVPVSVPPRRDVNGIAFLDSLKDLRPTLGLSLGCMQIFGPDLLQTLKTTVNFHDGLLPEYRGLHATGWSIYNREPRTGYTFHLMDQGIDTGPTLLCGQLPISPNGSVLDVLLEKAHFASRDADAVLDSMVRRSTGQPQTNPGRYFSARDTQRIRDIYDPNRLSADELLHRLRCFGVLNIKHQGRTYAVTALREASHGVTFRTSDDRRLAIHRCLALPPWLYRLSRRFRATPHP